MGRRALEVRPTYRKRKVWPWVAAAVALLGLGLWELRARRPEPVTPSAPAPAPASPRASAPLPPPAPSRPLPPPAPGQEVSGRVLTAAGEPAADVPVVSAPDGAEARSDAQGRFRVAAVPGTMVRLEAHHSDLGYARRDVTAPATDVELRLQPRATVAVRVLSEGRPVAGAELTVWQRMGEGALFHADRPTDAGGTLRVAGLPPGPLEVEALLPETGARVALSVQGEDGRTTQVTLLLPPAGVVRGTVVTRAGAPVPGAFVGVQEAEGLPARSGGDGTFVLRGLRPGREYRLTARTPELSLDAPVSARAGDPDVRLVVRERPVFRGRVLAPSGAPLGRFTVEGRPFVAADGRFELPLEPRQGEVELRVGSDGMLTRTVRAGATLSELGDIQLQPAPRLQGRVTLASGQPAVGAEVSAGEDTTRSDATGAFSLALREPPPSGTAVFVEAVLGDLAATAEVVPGRSVELVLSGEAPVRVRVLAADGSPAPNRSVQLAGPRTYDWKTGPDGTVAGKALAGDYRASSEARPGRVWFVRLPAPEVVLGGAGAGATLEVDLDAPVEALWVKGVASAPSSGERPGPRGEGQLVFGAERSARFEGLAPGTWTVVGLRQGVPVTRTVEVSGPTRVSL